MRLLVNAPSPEPAGLRHTEKAGLSARLPLLVLLPLPADGEGRDSRRNDRHRRQGTNYEERPEPSHRHLPLNPAVCRPAGM